jgi:hypothetical protein
MQTWRLHHLTGNYVTPPFAKLLATRTSQSGVRTPPGSLLALDPGETTGWAVFTNAVLSDHGQHNTSNPDLSLKEMTKLFDDHKPDEVIMEDYRVYAQRREQHVGSSLHTPRLIGLIETLCGQRGIPYHKQLASLAKGFVTDKKLRDWGLYDSAKRHSRDAIRHGCYFILFPPKTLLSRSIMHGGSKGHNVG